MSETPDGFVQRPAQFVPVGAGAQLAPTRWRALLAIAGVAAVTVLSVVYCVEGLRRSDRWHEGNGVLPTETAQQLNDTMRQIGHAIWLALIASAIGFAWWSRAIVLNAQRRGVARLSSRIATVAWFVPWFGLGPAMGQIARSVEGVGYSPHRVKWWNLSSRIGVPIVIFVEFTIGASWAQANNVSEKLDALDRQELLRSFATLWIVCTAVLAIRAVLHAHRAVSRF